MDDTETETEGYDSSSSFPFPRLPNVQLEINPTVSSPIPAPNPPEYANIHLETLVFPSTAPPSLRGSILVRNVAFCKIVAVRFTLDDWQTTSEVTCKHVVSLPSLPPPFRERENPGVPPSQWDRFSFILRLEDVERKLTERTIYLVARYQVPDQGEWWDNNNGSNYRISFQRSSSPQGSSLASRTTSAPPKLARPVAPPAPQVHRPPQPFKISTSPVGTAQSSPKSNAPSIKPSSPSPKLQLLNYASPATPPLTPPASAAPLPSPSLPEQPREIIGGQPATAPASFIPWPKSPSAKVDTSDSTYAAFVKQFCFIHSPAPGSSPPKVSPPTENLGGWLGFDKYGSGIRANSPALTSLSGI